MAIGTVKTLDIQIKGYPQQMEFVQSPSFETFFIGGLGSGKSYAGALKALKYCIENPGSWGMVTAPQFRILEIATIPTYEKIFPQELIASVKSRPHPEWKLHNGCRIFFWSTDKPETISGSSIAWAHIDEASLSPYAAFSNIKKRLRQRDAKEGLYPFQVWGTTTPRQLNWVYDECTHNKNAHVIVVSTFDNKYLNDDGFDSKDDAGIKAYIQRMGLKGKEYEQEIEGKFVLLSGECLFDQKILEERLKDCCEPTEVRRNGIIQIWKLPVIGGYYVAAADCSDEGGGGVNDLVIMDYHTGEEVACLNADIAADQFAMMCYDLLKEYNFPVFAPERNGTVGGMVIQKLKDMGYPNLYRDDKDREGWYTSASALPPRVSRFTMLQELEEAIRLRQYITHSSDAIGEFSTFVRSESGRYEPRHGHYADRVMSRAICWQLRKQPVRNKGLGLGSYKRRSTTYA